MRPTPAERFFAKVLKTSSCWLWTAATTPSGYGIFGVGGTTMSAHRWSYQFHVGAVDRGLEVDHLCRVPQCVNPTHLEPVTRSENMRRAWRARDLMAQRRESIDLTWPGFIAEFRSASSSTVDLKASA